MNWNEEEYTRKLRSYSHDTMLLISETMDKRSTFFPSVKIIMETDSEVEVAQKIKEILKQHQG